MVGVLWCARDFAFRLGQDRLGNVQCGCWTIEMDRNLSQVLSGRQQVLECCAGLTAEPSTLYD
jgi:hypothetical protein